VLTPYFLSRKEIVVMTIKTRYRRLIAFATAALLAPMALVATTSMTADAAASSHKHEVYIYKVELSLRLAGVGTDTVGDSTSPFIRCNSGDIALDGMWSVKSVDQYNPPLSNDPDEDPNYPSTSTSGGAYNDERDLHVVASYPDGVDHRRWNFEFKNRAFGDAQVKIFATCIRGNTEYTNSHRHQILVRDLPSQVNPAFTAHPSWPNERGYHEWSGDPSGASGCKTGEYFVAPGFKLSTSTTDFRLVASYPMSGSNGLGWTWEFGSYAVPAPVAWSSPSVTVYGKCISRKVGINGHEHALAMKHMPSSNVSTGHATTIPHGDPYETQYSCDQDEPDFHGYKAAVGWFWMGNFWQHHWFLGMEPRPKTRSFYFWNVGAVSASVTTGALCINSRTSNPIL
jgi:hypothetical protein